MHSEELAQLFEAGVAAVRGDSAVKSALKATSVSYPDQIIAVGKAATAMASAATEAFPKAPVLIITKYKHSEGAPPKAEVIEAAHPVLDENSLRAGRRLREVISAMPSGSNLLMLVSGGASALAEDPANGLDLAGLSRKTEELLGSGADIHAMNAVRKELSQIKGGKLLSGFHGSRVTTLAISDVQGDALGVIGSGIGDAPANPQFEFDPHIVASNARARQSVLDAASARNLPAYDYGETLYEDIVSLAPKIAAKLKTSAPGIVVMGGEPTVVLPENPGRGGRNQALALMIAREIADTPDLQVLVAGTDGTDGPTDAAGAIVDGSTWELSGEDALACADAGSWLDARDALLTTGPTGTNVMDLLIAWKG